jgi:hypothetical protein
VWLRPGVIPGDFDGLDAPESWFLSHRLVPQVTDKLANKKKRKGNKSKFRSYIVQLRSKVSEAQIGDLYIILHSLDN